GGEGGAILPGEGAARLSCALAIVFVGPRDGVGPRRGGVGHHARLHARAATPVDGGREGGGRIGGARVPGGGEDGGEGLILGRVEIGRASCRGRLSVAGCARVALGV